MKRTPREREIAAGATATAIRFVHTLVQTPPNVTLSARVFRRKKITRCTASPGDDSGTLLHEALVRFAFDVMASGKEFCNKQDVIGLVSLLHSQKARVRDTTNTLMGIMDPHNRDKVSFETFRKEERRLGSMLFPAFKLQKTLRAKVCSWCFSFCVGPPLTSCPSTIIARDHVEGGTPYSIPGT